MRPVVSTMLRDEFGFEGVLGGEEYEKFPAWKKDVADLLLSKGIEYFIAKENFREAAKQEKKYIEAATELYFGKARMMPLWAKSTNVQEFVLVLEMLKNFIDRLIKIYNAG